MKNNYRGLYTGYCSVCKMSTDWYDAFFTPYNDIYILRQQCIELVCYTQWLKKLIIRGAATTMARVIFPPTSGIVATWRSPTLSFANPKMYFRSINPQRRNRVASITFVATVITDPLALSAPPMDFRTGGKRRVRCWHGQWTRPISEKVWLRPYKNNNSRCFSRYFSHSHCRPMRALIKTWKVFAGRQKRKTLYPIAAA